MITVYNAGGTTVIRHSTDHEISLTSLPRGVYFVRYEGDRRHGILKVMGQ